jgi:predicted ester cyclase
VSTERNQKTARRIVVELFNAGGLDLVDTLFAADFVDHSLPPDIPPNREGFKSMIPILRQAFPDLQYTIEDQIAEGDKVAQRITGRGTLKGEFMGMQPTGRTAVWQEMHWHRFNTDGLLVEHWDITDSLGMLTQLAPQSDPG